MHKRKYRRPSPKLLRRLLDYCPKTGELRWKERPAWMFPRGRFGRECHKKAFDTKFTGQIAFRNLHPKGYLLGQIWGRSHKAHRVAYAIAHGVWPDDQIDHINGDRSDNRIENLRAVSQIENMKNRKMPSHNTSGYVGVRQRKNGSWRASVRVSGKRIDLGTHATLDAALAAREAAALKHGFHPNHGRAG